MENSNIVWSGKCRSYDGNEVSAVVGRLLSGMGVGEEQIKGKRVVLKPNLLLAYQPEKAATTHPEVVYAVLEYLKKLEPASLVVAESPGGVYTESALKHIYGATGMTEAAEKAGIPLNFNTEYVNVEVPEKVETKSFSFIRPIAECDVIVNVCKAKTHSLATLTGAAKNLFGLIPGIGKFEMHARFKDPTAFFNMIADLNLTASNGRKVISVCDAITCMEGNGPSGGTPKFAGMLFSSYNTFALDLALSHLMSLENEVPLIRIAQERGLVADSFGKLEIVGDEIPSIEFAKADGSLANKFRLIPKFLQPRPYIDKKLCRGCFLCVRSCPQHTIEKKNGYAKIISSNCIKCFCCQELCTFKAVRIKKNFIYKLIH